MNDKSKIDQLIDECEKKDFISSTKVLIAIQAFQEQLSRSIEFGYDAMGKRWTIEKAKQEWDKTESKS